MYLHPKIIYISIFGGHFETHGVTIGIWGNIHLILKVGVRMFGMCINDESLIGNCLQMETYYKKLYYLVAILEMVRFLGGQRLFWITRDTKSTTPNFMLIS